MVFYEPGKTPHDLPHDPFKSCVIPRPIGWLSTRSPTGHDNLAPFSQFTNLTFDPPYIAFSANQSLAGARKDTVANIEATGVFVWNMATYALREAVNATAQDLPADVDEFAIAGLEKEAARMVEATRVKASPVKFECRYHSTLRLPGNPPMGSVDVVIGRVVGVDIDDGALTKEGRVDVGRIQPIARLGYKDYCVVRAESIFEMVIPGDEKQLVGLEGNAKKHAEKRAEGEGHERER